MVLSYNRRDPNLHWQLKGGLARLTEFTGRVHGPLLAAAEASKKLGVRLSQMTDVRDTARLFAALLDHGHDVTGSGEVLE